MSGIFRSLRAPAGALALAAGLAFWSIPAVPASAAPFVPPPSPARWVTDDVGFLSPQARQALDDRLGSYQRQSGHQLLLWIGRTAGDTVVEDFTSRTFAAWRVGRKGIDDGLALFIFTDDRKVRFEVGYGLEGSVPDLIASRIIREIVVPRIQAGDHDGAAIAGMEAAIAAVEGKPFDSASSGTSLSSDYEQPSAPRGPPQPMGLGAKILIGLLGLAFLILLVTHPSLAIYLLINLLSGGRGGGEGGGGGGGGFSGGGGRSGGGGATGSW